MKTTIRKNILPEYTLHDMNIVSLELMENDLILRTQSGIVCCKGKGKLVDGYVLFRQIKLDFCNVYLMKSNGRYGKFETEKITLQQFLNRFDMFGFSIVDEVYGYNQTKYWGYLTTHHEFFECILEIYHTGDMFYIEQ